MNRIFNISTALIFAICTEFAKADPCGDCFEIVRCGDSCHIRCSVVGLTSLEFAVDNWETNNWTVVDQSAGVDVRLCKNVYDGGLLSGVTYLESGESVQGVAQPFRFGFKADFTSVGSNAVYHGWMTLENVNDELVVSESAMSLQSETLMVGVLIWNDPKTGIPWAYKIENGSAMIHCLAADTPAIPKTTAGKVLIPDKIKDCPVVRIYPYSFYGCNMMTEIVIPSTVTNIGGWAFHGCSKVSTVNIPEGVEIIPEYAFHCCYCLKNVYMPTSVRRIDSFAFGSCYQLISADLQEGVLSVGDYAFYGCASISAVTVPRSVTTMGDCAFKGCSSIRKVSVSSAFQLKTVFPDSYQAIESVNVIPGTTEIKASTFDSCGSLTNVVFPAGIASIGASAFYCCSKLERVVIPYGVATIGNSAFSMCTSLKTIKIPPTVWSLGNYTFSGCSALDDVTIPSCVATLSKTFPSAYKTMTKVVVCDGVVTIGASTFAGAESLKTVILPASVTSIGNSAFSGCGSLTSLVLNGDAPDLAANAFEGTPKRLVISVPENSIGWNGGLTTTLPDTWGGRAIVHSGQSYDWDSGTATMQNFYLTITNVVIQYVLRSAQPEIAVPISGDTGFVNVITEVVSEGAVAVPSVWRENYVSFETKFGDDFVKALMKPTGKVDGAGNAMLVWQDYVAGTDPTNPDDKFTASVMMVDGEPVISWTPELPADQADLRKYTTYGKARLQDAEWTVVNGDAAKYNFFKVTVEMK